MKIRKFNESSDDIVDISNDRIKEIIQKVTSISVSFNEKKEEVQSLTYELSNYRSKSKKSNDQIDDSVSNLEGVNTKISDILLSLDTIVNNLKDYYESGRKFLY